MNSVELVGRLTKDPILNRTKNDKSVVNFTIAVDKGFGKKEADFFPIVVWGKQAESLAKFKKKGDRISVKGKLSNKNYDKDGVKYFISEIIANNIQFLDNAKRNISEGSRENENSFEESNIYDSNEVTSNIQEDDDPFKSFDISNKNPFVGCNNLTDFTW
ncbi:single-stranded DNA-binding protein [Clostridium botulinum]|uniref:Single-stranded DNA-binding protein n=1 Tax=Clostridium botulinum TaxID=1491 RepID=A0A6M0SQA1_CLOBO|nr:single-stranded DNA-binding protein [Clostridium botulinum]